jgi:hypothetical protein
MGCRIGVRNLTAKVPFQPGVWAPEDLAWVATWGTSSCNLNFGLSEI